MVVGFNHNFRYKGEIFHIQTEDSGRTSPHIITLLYRGGTILGSKKTSYADIIKVDNLEQVVEDLMKEQHKEMLRKLKAGEFDAVIERLLGIPKDQAAPAARPEPAAALAEPPAPPQPAPAAAAKAPAEPAPPRPKPPAPAPSLDEVILSYLVGEDQD